MQNLQEDKLDKYDIAGKLSSTFINSPLTPLIAIVIFLLGFAAIFLTPREENPQIDVPSASVIVPYPGASADEVQRIIIEPLSRKLNEMSKIKHIYGMAQNNYGVVSAVFEVGENKEISFLKLYDRVMQNMDLMPKEVMQPLIKPVDIDEVPILTFAIASQKYSDSDLYKIAQRLITPVAEVKDVSVVEIKGGHKRQFNIFLDPEKLSGYSLSIGQVVETIQKSSASYPLGEFSNADYSIPVEFPAYIYTKKDVEDLIIAVYENRPIYIKDIANVKDFIDLQNKHKTFLGVGEAFESKGLFTQQNKINQVTVAVSKKRGTNAVFVSQDVVKKIQDLKNTLPDGVELIITRDDGKKANESVNELIFHILISIAIIVVLLMVMLGFREALIVSFTIPLILAVTLFIGMMADQTINRITLFALILALGLLVDDAIVVIENIHRHFEMKKMSREKAAIFATREVGKPTNIATTAVIFAFLPMLFVGGMMGPYMGPIPFNVPIAMIVSLIIAYIFTPYLAVRFLKTEHHKEAFNIENSKIFQLYNLTVKPMLEKRVLRYLFMFFVIGLFVVSILLPIKELVLFKMLPSSNTNTLNITIDLPSGSSLERTQKVTSCVEDVLIKNPYVADFETFLGIGGVIDFNGLLRGGGMKKGENLSEIRVNFKDKHIRDKQSSVITSALRPDVQKCQFYENTSVKLVEDPPGPPVVATLVSEIYGGTKEGREKLALTFQELYKNTQGVVDIDIKRDEKIFKYQVIPDKTKSALSGISTTQIAQALAIGLNGDIVSLVRIPDEKEQVGIFVRYKDEYKNSPQDIEKIKIMSSSNGAMIPLYELVKVIPVENDRLITTKDLKETMLVTAEMDKRGSIYALIDMWQYISKGNIQGYEVKSGLDLRQTTELIDKDSGEKYIIKWTGEWEITFDVFRDLGSAFGIAVVLIYLLMVAYYKNFRVPGIILLPVPLTFIGVLPGHLIMDMFIMETYFTATSMIGFIALAGIVVRNSLLLIDFTQELIDKGVDLNRAVIEAASTRFRPILLTALAIVLASVVIVADPVWQGLAVSLIFGVFVSTFLTLVVVPLMFWRYKKRAIKRSR